MKLSMICFTLQGLQTAEKIKEALLAEEEALKEKPEISIFVKSRYLEGSIEESVGMWTGKQFASEDGIIFIGATGIAVRSIAPYVASKKKDPAVLVVDECGKYVISLLSGHLGGANELTGQVAHGIGAIPVVTTATDLHDQFAVDVFAKKNDCAIFHMKAAKAVSAALLAGEEIGFYSELPFTSSAETSDLSDKEENSERHSAEAYGNQLEKEHGLPKGLIFCDREGIPLENGKTEENRPKRKPRIGVAVTISKECMPFEETVTVVPKILILGIGTRKGKEPAAVKKAAEECLSRGGYFQEAVAALASIDIKKEEPGILALAKEWGVPFLTFSEQELLLVPGEFTPSQFVKKITGVDNVCERSAVLAAGQHVLLQNKVGADGVTTALAKKKGGLKF